MYHSDYIPESETTWFAIQSAHGDRGLRLFRRANQIHRRWKRRAVQRGCITTPALTVLSLVMTIPRAEMNRKSLQRIPYLNRGLSRQSWIQTLWVSVDADSTRQAKSCPSF